VTASTTGPYRAAVLDPVVARGSTAAAGFDVCAEVRTGDEVLIPYGYQGPSMAAPGYDLYYLNVMAGPGERVWRFCDDPAHAWIRGSWEESELDSRLPFYTAGERA
jgi:5-deoxy-glucuronate isomerase